MFETDFLLKVLDDNGIYYYDEDESPCLYHGLECLFRELKTRVAIAQLVKKDPKALLQYIYDKRELTSAIDWLNSRILAREVFNNPKIFKILIKKVEPEFLGKTLSILFERGDDVYQESAKILYKTICDDRVFGKAFCKGIMLEFIDKYRHDGDFFGASLLMKIVIDKMETSNEKNIDYVELFNNIKNSDFFYLIYDSIMKICIDDEEKKEIALKFCEEFVAKGDKNFSILKKRIDKGFLKPEDLYRAFTKDMIPDAKAINSFLISNTFALSEVPVGKQKEINLKELNKLLEISRSHYPSGPTELDDKIVLKMLLSLGFKHTKEILEGKYGYLNAGVLSGAFRDLNPSDYEVADKQVKHTRCQAAMVRFLFGNGVDDENSNIRRLLRGEVDTKLWVVIRNWRLIYALSQGKVKLSEISGLLDDSVLLLQEYQQSLRGIIKEAGPDYLEQILETYDRMLQRSESTIPKVKGQVDDLEYEVLDLDSVEQMSVGYITKCCFTFEGESSSSLDHALTSDSGRILVIRKNGKLVAQSWLWRDGNVLCFDDIETTGLSRKSDEAYLKVCVDAAGKLLEASAEAEPEKERIEIVTVGISPNPNGVQKKTAQKILTKLDEKDVILPLADLYTDAGTQFILGKSPTYEHTKRFIPKARYQDERTKIIICDPQQCTEEELKKTGQTIAKIETISKSEREIEVSDFTFVICGKDWFIGIYPDGSLAEGVFGSDKRQNKEMLEAYKLISEKSKSGELKEFLDDAELSKRMEAKTNGTK